jgi:ethanolamine ammonia-lyase small subunit
MNLQRLRDYTSARVALGRAGVSLPTHELLDFQLAHARARDAVHAKLDPALLARDLGAECIFVKSAACDRAAYLRRPDLGRQLSQESATRLQPRDMPHVVVIADGLSALAVHRHAPAIVERIAPRVTPVVIVEQGRVAIGDEIGERLGAKMVVILIGERPGLSSPDSLGIYLTWNPVRGRTDAERNCISNIRADGLSYDAAANRLQFLMNESRRRGVSGVALKDESHLIE